MSSPEMAFEKLVGRRATDGERQKLYRVRDTLGVKSTDAVWTLLLVLEHYLALYETFPQRLEDAARTAVAGAKATAEAQAKAAAAEVKRALTAGVLATVNDTARAATVKDILKWVAMTVITLSVVLVAVGMWAFRRGAAEAQARAAQVATQDRERRIAETSWVNTVDGRLAYDLAKAGMLHDMVTCSGRGLLARDGWCIAQGERGRPYRWRSPETQVSR
jgi:cbb3-type cytochrome oxidase subunit 3